MGINLEEAGSPASFNPKVFLLARVCCTREGRGGAAAHVARLRPSSWNGHLGVPVRARKAPLWGGAGSRPAAKWTAADTDPLLSRPPPPAPTTIHILEKRSEGVGKER